MVEMSSMDVHAESFAIPSNACTIAGFRAWKQSAGYPERGRIDFCDGEVLVDMSSERVETHALVKGEIYRVLQGIVRRERLGVMFPDGVTYTSEPARLVTEPDGLFIRRESFREGRVRGGHEFDDPLGFSGVVDWILEVVSPSSVKKDRQRWLEKYAQARVGEYWIVDARSDRIAFDVFVLGSDGYRLQPDTDGWRESEVFERSFRLERAPGEFGLTDYTLSVR